MYLIKNKNTDTQAVREVIGYVVQSGGIAYATQKMEQYRNEALELLSSMNPDPASLQSVKDLVNFVIERNK